MIIQQHYSGSAKGSTRIPQQSRPVRKDEARIADPARLDPDVFAAAMAEDDLIESMRSGGWMREHRQGVQRLQGQAGQQRKRDDLRAYQREYQRRYRAAHRKPRECKPKLSDEERKARAKQSSRCWKTAHREEVRDYQRRYRLERREQIREYQHDWRERRKQDDKAVNVPEETR